MYDMTFLSLFAAALAHVVVGMGWYHPRIFGSMWTSLVNLSPAAVEELRKNLVKSMGLGFIAAVAIAYVFSHLAIAWGVYDWAGAVELAFWMWLGLIVPVLMGPVLWEGKPWKLFFINAGYWVTSLIIMALILAL